MMQIITSIIKATSHHLHGVGGEDHHVGEDSHPLGYRRRAGRE